VQTNGGSEEATTYTYDDVDRLATVTYAPDAEYPNGRTVTYGHDGAGNRETEVVTDPQTEAVLESKTGHFDNANRLTELTDNLDAGQTTTLAWDRNGNLLSETKAGVTTTYRHDLRDTLAEVERGGQTLARFLGDFDERRVLKIGDPTRPGGSGVQEYVYNGSRLVLDVENGQPTARYEWTNEELVSLLQSGGQRRYFALDGLETVLALTDESGQAIDRLNFDAWGVPKEGTDFGTSGSRFAFTSHRFDTELNLYYAGGRMYSPTIGRFISQDTLSLDPNNPDSWNLFAYARGNPTFYTDPTGHYSWSEFKSDAKWGKDFIVAFGSDLAQNAPDRAVRIAGATVQQAGELAVQTAAMAHDTAVLTADAAARVTTGEGFDNITLYSQMAQSSAQRLGRGESVGDIIKDSAFEMGANALTVGTYGTFKEQFSTAAEYLSGNATIEQVESRLINAAGGAVLNAGLGAVGAKVAGEGWMGKPVSVPSPATVVESFSQLPGRARATAQSAWDATSRVLNSEVKLTFDPTVMSMNGFGGVGVKLVPPKAAAAASKGVPETVAGVSRHAGPEAFRRSHPEYGSGSGYEVHHSVEWNALQRYRGTFTPEQLNLESMMRPLRSGQTMQGRSIHRSVVRKSWDNFRDVFQERFEQGLISPDRMQKLLLTHRDFIDRMYLGRTPGL
jgi:RHS repeat-associated protein